MRALTAACAALVVVTLAACGDDLPTSGDPAEHSYDGPLHLDGDDARHPQAGAAGDVVECDTWGAGGFESARVYSEGATADSPAEALGVARGEALFSGVQEDLLVAKREADRVLYVLEVGGVVKQAVIVRDGPATEGAGGPGWYVESWARCDYAELPRTFTDSIGLQVWNDATGRPVPTKKLESWAGPEHCDWQSMTFLKLGAETYVRDPQPGLEDFFSDRYDAHAPVPADATDSGYQRKGAHLWVAPDKGVIYVGARDDAEVWPRMVEEMACA